MAPRRRSNSAHVMRPVALRPHSLARAPTLTRPSDLLCSARHDPSDKTEFCRPLLDFHGMFRTLPTFRPRADAHAGNVFLNRFLALCSTPHNMVKAAPQWTTGTRGLGRTGAGRERARGVGMGWQDVHDSECKVAR
ncbi:hypothetical protein EVJ58_g10759 [Rhodofomes roseus]|uniref:Uncharacterized protein n=1 Tax=Rhodofomes roseus TaxID=34475 RepID=A0A4Y9XPA4_9APHY|nr:hypothetical protein EVJ58_g10759 [Rhodofomes roseus]